MLIGQSPDGIIAVLIVEIKCTIYSYSYNANASQHDPRKQLGENKMIMKIFNVGGGLEENHILGLHATKNS